MAGEELQPFRVDALAMGGMGGPPAPGPADAPAAAAATKQDAGYPTIEHICSKKSNYQAFSSAAAETLERLQAAGGPEAQRALKAYSHLTDTLGKLVEMTKAEVQRLKKQQKG